MYQMRKGMVVAMLEKVKEFYEQEYQDAKNIIERKPNWCVPQEVINNSIQRCLGVAQFVQTVGVKYEDLDIYDEYREKLLKLFDK